MSEQKKARKKGSKSVNRLVTFITTEDYKLFRELAYQRQQCSAELIREILHNYLQQNKPSL